ncbi:hypothetical protein [Ferruginibacter sp.]
MIDAQFQTIRKFIEQKSLSLMNKEKRPFANAGFDISKYHEIKVEDRNFVIIATNVFYHILHSVLAEASEKYPELFGNNDVNGVLEAIYNIENVGEFEQFADFLKTEQFAWIVELINEQINPNVLRVEIFRQIDTIGTNATKTEFTGGLLHTFRHFNYKGVPLSTKKEKNDIEHPKTIIDFLIRGFFFTDINFTNKTKCNSNIILNNKYKLRFDYYFEPETKIYFVNSIRKEK